MTALLLIAWSSVKGLWAKVPAWGRYGLAGALALAAAFLAGRYTRPPKVVTQVQTHETVRTVDHVVTVVQRAQVITRYRTITITPSAAGPIRTETISTKVDTDTHTSTDGHVAQASVADSVSSQHVDTAAGSGRSVWHVRAMGGVLIQPKVAPAWLVGGQAERQIAGPFYGGLWAVGTPTGSTKAGAVGISLGVDF